MQTRIHPELIELPLVKEADSILRRCVHCGFCTATCPTYQLLGDELDGPRGRIYLLKNFLEENTIDSKSMQHLDRCLTCRACETTCPSGVEYSRLLDIGKGLISERRKPPVLARIKSLLSRWIIPREHLFKPLLRTGQMMRAVLPASVANRIPPKQDAIPAPGQQPENPDMRVLLLQGCAQRSATPNVNAALECLLTDRNVAVTYLSNEGCCGAVDYHLSAHAKGLQRMRELIDKLHARLDEIDYIVSSASGCGVTIKEYPLHLAEDPEYAEKAQQVVAKVVDVSELLGRFEFSCSGVKAVVHTPCTLQHGQGINGQVETILERAGINVSRSRESHLCCGSAGTYSIMQADISQRLLSRKLDVLQENDPQFIITANVGCQLHLQTRSNAPVLHWVELLHQQSKA